MNIRRTLILLLCTLSIVILSGCDFFGSPDTDEVKKIGQENESNQYDDTDDDEYIAMTPDECFPEEKFDKEEKVCYFECDSDEECNAIEAKIDARLAEIGEAYYEGDKEYEELKVPKKEISTKEANSESKVESQPIEKNGEESGGYIIGYTVKGNNITSFDLPNVSDDLKKWQTDVAKHKEIWEYFSKMIPEQERVFLTKYEIFTDGKEGTFAAVNANDDNPNEWTLVVDIADAYKDNTLDQKELSYTMVHEFGHLLTLNKTQAPPIDSSHIESDEAYRKFELEQQKKCAPEFFTGEGCSLANSYINQFYQKYWKDIYGEFNSLESISDENAYEEAASAFYEKYQSRFVTDYSSTNPGEDIAESWTAFVIKNKPTGTSIADKKVLFFYEYPSIVRLRQHVRANL